MTTEANRKGDARREISAAYHRTTSGISKAYAGELESGVAGLRRRLGTWMPPSGARLLDLGCGHGELLLTLARAGVTDTTGVNLSQDELVVARSLVASEFVCGDAIEYVSRTDKTFDVVTAFNFLEHLDKDSLLACLRGIHRCLKPGGCLIVMVPNAVSPFSSVTRHWDLTHEWAFTRSNFRQLAVLCGFNPDVQCKEAAPVPHGLVSGIRWLLWQGLRLLIRGYLLIETADSKGGVYTMDMMVRLRKD
jgi:2-polyprenyl-3-methyl-5-hydroxy-6-metoxy-1,4-benzoquinol methylase